MCICVWAYLYVYHFGRVHFLLATRTHIGIHLIRLTRCHSRVFYCINIPMLKKTITYYQEAQSFISRSFHARRFILNTKFLALQRIKDKAATLIHWLDQFHMFFFQSVHKFSRLHITRISRTRCVIISLSTKKYICIYIIVMCLRHFIPRVPSY